jgi:splicing factor 3B subunit 1
MAALDRRNYNQVVETTVELANKVSCSDIVSRIVDDLKYHQVEAK